jgi:hypothetical protein
MDLKQFDALARTVSTRHSRRTALATVLGALLVSQAPALVTAKRNGNGNGNGHGHGHGRNSKGRKDRQERNAGGPTACGLKVGTVCSVFDPHSCGDCPGMVCTPSSITPLLTTCQAECPDKSRNIGSCQARLGDGWGCDLDPFLCLYIGGICCSRFA